MPVLPACRERITHRKAIVMKKNFIRLIAVMLLIAFTFTAFAACKKNKDDDDDVTTNAPTESTAEPGKETEVPVTEVPVTEVPVTEVPPTEEPVVDDATALLGTWETEIDFSEAMTSSANEDGQFGDLEFHDICFTVLVTFNEDGTYTAAADEETAAAAFEAMIDQMAPVIVTMMKAQVAEALGKEPDEVTDEEALELLGLFGVTSWDELIDMFREQMDPSEMTEEMESTGRYELRDGKIYMEDFFDMSEDESTWNRYELTANTLTLELPEDTSELDEEMVKIYPLVFRKVG